MSFYGKKFKKVKFDKISELMDKLDVPETTRQLLKQTESVSSFIKNADGTIQYVVTLGNKEVMSQKIVLGEEQDYTTPDGMACKVTFTLDGGKLKSVMKLPNDKVLYIDREFEENTMTLYVWLEGVDLKASVTYEVV